MFKHIHHFFHHHYHRRYHGFYKHAKQLFVFDIILLITAILIFLSSLFFFFWKPSLVDQIEISFAFNTTSSIRSGEETHLIINYTNNSKETLDSPTLALRLPKGFVLDKNRTPENFFSEPSTFTLKPIEPGESGHTDIYGKLWSEPNREDKLVTILSYIPKNKKQPEQKVTSFFITVPTSVLQSTFTITTSSFPGQSLPFKYTLTNAGKEVLSNITIKGPSTTSFSTNLITDQPFSLAPGEIKTVINSLLAPNKPGKYPIDFSSEILINNTSIPQTHDSATLDIIYPQLDSEIQLKSNASFADPGAILPVNVSWKNNSSFHLSSMKLVLDFSPSDVVDIQKTGKEAGFKIENNKLVVDSSKRTALSNGNPGNKDSFDLQVFLLPHFNLASEEKVSLTITPVMEGRTEQIGNQIFNQPGKAVTIPLATDVTMTSEVRYFTVDGEQLGRGPLPPRVGETTKYWVFVTINNTTNPLKNAHLKANLPPGVTFTSKQSTSIGDPLRLENNTIVWNTSELPPHSQTKLYFEVAVLPSATQKGLSLPLLENITFRAQDSFVSKDIVAELLVIDNKLQPNDKGSRSSAKVVGN